MFRSISRYRSHAILILAVFIAVVILFAGYHAMNGWDRHGTSHQADAYSCLFTICVAIFTIPMLFILLLSTTAILDLIPFPESGLLFILEKPPRG